MLEIGYNERLFSTSALRSYYHRARFLWFAAEVEKLAEGPLRVLELGCFDAKTIDFIRRPLERYVGIDANWEGGLDLARERFAGRPEIELIEARSPDALGRFGDGEFNLAVSLETLEHVPPEIVDDYLAEIRRVTRGPLLVSVPNELGLVFLAKWAAKKLWYGAADPYSSKEVVAATLWQSHKIERAEHKGFDYRQMIRQIGRHFDVLRVDGFPGNLPPALSLSVGISARPRARN